MAAPTSAAAACRSIAVCIHKLLHRAADVHVQQPQPQRRAQPRHSPLARSRADLLLALGHLRAGGRRRGRQAVSRAAMQPDGCVELRAQGEAARLQPGSAVCSPAEAAAAGAAAEGPAAAAGRPAASARHCRSATSAGGLPACGLLHGPRPAIGLHGAPPPPHRAQHLALDAGPAAHGAACRPAPPQMPPRRTGAAMLLCRVPTGSQVLPDVRCQAVAA